MLLTLIMSLFSSILIGLAPVNSGTISQEIENTVEVKRKDNFAKTSGCICVSPVEILSNVEFYTNFDTSTLYNLETNQTYSLPYITSYTKAVYYLNIGHSYTEGTDFGYNLGQDISSAYFTYTSQETHENAVHKYYNFRINLSNTNFLRYDIVLSFFVDSRTSEYEDGQLFASSVSSIGLYYSNGTSIPTRPSYYLVGNSVSWLYSAKGVGGSNYDEGFTNGYNAGVSEGYSQGYNTAVTDVLNPDDAVYQGIYDTGFNAGKQQGDTEGYQRAISQGSTAATIFSGIVTVGLLPVNVLLTMFQYEVFGINIAGLVSGLFTIAVVIIIIRLVTGKKND